MAHEGKMNADLERLVSLQKLDSEIARKSNLLKTLPEEINRHGADLDKAKAALKTHDDAVEAEKKGRRDLEREVEVTKDSIAKSKSKLPGVKTNVEYRAILKEIENFEAQIKQLEDKELELMEKMEGGGNLRKPLEDKVKEEEQKFKVIKTEKEAAIQELTVEAERLTAERKATIEGISSNVLTDYERILKARDGMGVALVSERLCMGCNQLVPPQLYYLIRTTDEIYKCPHCSRFLYHEAKETENAVK